MRASLVACLLACSFALPARASDPATSARGVAARVFGEQIAAQLELQVIPADPESGHDAYELDYDRASSRVVIRGNSGVAISAGVYQYMSDYLNASVAWGVNRTGVRFDSVSPLPAPTAVRVVRAFKHSYSWNVCTFGYSAAFWDWARWQRELDWLALHGVNLPLAFAGQELVWQKLWLEVGMTDSEVREWFSGPAFLPWQRMGNIMAWGGPLDQDWIEGQAELQQSILDAMMELGMRPVLPGFPGHVPKALRRIYPNASITSTAPWGHFNATYTEVPFLEPTDSHFQALATRFYEIQRDTFGAGRDWSGMAYNADQFNEMEPRNKDPSYLAAANRAVWQAMSTVDANATYVMQAWLFHEQFWTAAAVKAYLSGVPTGRMLILDLNAEEQPLWSKFDSFYGHNFIWNALHNYGGRSGMYGNLTRVATGPPGVKEAMPTATIVGTGFTPEAILQNPVYYELVTRMSWEHKAVDADRFVTRWSQRRYGANSPSAVAAWLLMRRTIYDTAWSWTRWGEVEARPQATVPDRSDLNATASAEALRLLVQAGSNGELDPTSGPYRHDLVDLASQVMQFVFTDEAALLRKLVEQLQAKGSKDPAGAAQVGAAMQAALSSLDALLSTDPSFLLGHWLQEAVTSPNTTTPDQVANRLFNAKNQITLWGLGNIHDYASKLWGGLVGSYYAPRWAMFQKQLLQDLQSGAPFDQAAFVAELIPVELQWNESPARFPDQVSGADPLKTAETLVEQFVNASAAVKAQFEASPGVDHNGGDVVRAYTRDLDQLMLLCSRTEACLGFNYPGGYLKSSLTAPTSSPGSTFYAKVK
ncbi:hypothetical protein FNF27_07033 [Cafeteria roenbergensis]|uniref:Alpha-N-acetylglucosaminidase n=1 Tax=Cafeteria roenbergensis TaxID=33653 RepID=A0A5A8DX15_CAFRO|nr:hypothetical protein FNF27_07033 [Cafeteria roenbergensis]